MKKLREKGEDEEAERLKASFTYRSYVYVRGEKTSSRPGFSAEQVKKVLAEGGKLSRGEVFAARDLRLEAIAVSG